MENFVYVIKISLDEIFLMLNYLLFMLNYKGLIIWIISVKKKIFDFYCLKIRLILNDYVLIRFLEIDEN